MSESRTELEKEIDRTREHLAETVDALTGKLDVKSRAKGKAADVKEAAQHKAQDAVGRRMLRPEVHRVVLDLGHALAQPLRKPSLSA